MQPMVTMALRAARKAGQIIIQSSTQLDVLKIETKQASDYVTQVDRTAERAILHVLKKAYPDHGFICEESGTIEGKGEGKEYQWIIDPLDGTTNFIHGIPYYAVSIACVYRGRLEHAVVYDPVRDEEFCASRGRGASLNGRRIRVSERRGLAGAVLGTGLPFRDDQQPYADNYFQMLRVLSRDTAGIRRQGAAALDLAYVAAGRYDGFWEMGLKEWDMAGGCLLVTEAGGLASDLKGGHGYRKSGHLVCGSPKVFKEMLTLIHPFSGVE